MKINVFNPINIIKGEKLMTLTLEEFVDSVKANVGNETIMAYRDYVEYTDSTRVENLSDTLPRVYFQTEVKSDGRNALQFGIYNGLVAIIAGSIPNRKDVEQAKIKAISMPQTLAAMIGADGRSLIILVKAQRPDGTLPNSEDDAQRFHAAAYQQAIMTYSVALECPIDIKRPEIMQSIMFPCDENPYIAENPSVFVVAQPTKMPEDRLDEIREGNHNKRIAYGLDYYATIEDVLRALHRQAINQSYDVEDNRDLHIVAYIAQAYALADMPEEECVYYIMEHFRQLTESEIRQELRIAYSDIEQKQKIGSSMPVDFIPKSQRIAMQVQEFVNRRFEVQYNEITGTTELRKKQSIDFVFRELTQERLNRICHEAALEGLEITDSALKRYIFSDYTPKRNPISEFLDNLPEWDGRDRITELMQLVPTDNPYWVELGSRWFLSMVNHWLNPYQVHANSTAPVLIGGQGFRKSTFCKNILPPQLSQFYTDAIDFRNEVEAERFLSRFMLINIDEFDKLSPNRFAYIKHMFQKTQTAHRQLFKETISNSPRYASFIATSNCYDILKDPTGNRRFLCIEVKDVIRTETPIDYGQLYAQAVSQINSGVRCWINDEDEAKIQGMNKVFEEQSPLEELFLTYFRKPENDAETVLLRPIDIMQELKKKPEYHREMGTEMHLGKILTKLRFKVNRLNKGKFYAMCRV